jgi:signal transduction histidine kinase
MSSVQVFAVIEAALETMRLLAQAKHIALEAKLSAVTAEINGDANRLQQVLCNLLTNVIKFTPSGGSIQVWLEHSDSQVQVHVGDTGIGIRREFLPHVFEAFRQDKTASSNFHGLGIGLAVARHLVELHGGAIQVESQGEGKGATFTLTLPSLSPSDSKASADRAFILPRHTE